MTVSLFLKEKIKAAALKAIADKIDVVAVTEGNGIVVVREDSSEGTKRQKRSGVVAERVVVSDIVFLVCNA